MVKVDFLDSDAPSKLVQASQADLDALNFGVVTMEHGGKVCNYNAFESALSGYSKEQVKGRDFFVSVAPCTNNWMVRERFFSDEFVEMTIDYVFSFRMKTTPVQLRMVAWPEGPWLLLVQKKTS